MHAFAGLHADDAQPRRTAEELEQLAIASFLAGDDNASIDAWTRAHQQFLDAGSVARAARSAFWLAFVLQSGGQRSRSAGWLARARRLLADHPHECVEAGYLLFPEALQNALAGNLEQAYDGFARAVDIGEGFHDADLVTLARQAQGRVLIQLGRIDEGVALLDETMAAIDAGGISPLVIGNVYCSMIEACHDMLDMRRAQEWTNALARWCDAQPNLVPFRGQCLVRRAEIMRLHGEWPQALQEAERACERLSSPPPPQPAIGGALYQRAELHRLRGEFAKADTAYREAAHWLRRPAPGHALLRLAQGDVESAWSMIRTLLGEAHGTSTRAPLLAAFVEIALAAGDAAAARQAAAELRTQSQALAAPLLRAMAAEAEGLVALAAGDAQSALDTLQSAHAHWLELDAPYEAARVRVQMGRACRGLGDEQAARSELEAAAQVLRGLGAEPEVQRTNLLLERAPGSDGGLTPRELQVLRLVAAGSTNRVIASKLFISEKTVARHISNIFLKLGLSTRAAAAAYAHTHGLAQPPA